jgi:acetoin utilization protein AcuB
MQTAVKTHMNVSEIMTKNPVTVHPDAKLRDALEKMEKANCHHLPVQDANGHVIGILSDRDCRLALNSPYILRERWQDEEIVNNLLVRTMMTPAPVIVEHNANAQEAARLMFTNQISSLPVMRSETLVGIVTRSDILVAFMNMFENGEKPQIETTT